MARKPNLQRTTAPPNDIWDLRRIIPDIAHLPAHRIEELWSGFCDKEFAARWLSPQANMVEPFLDWCETQCL